MFWSLICEAVYYVLYPGLRSLAKRFGWTALTGAAYLAAGVLALLNPQAQMYVDLGAGCTWLLGLPIFLLGCGLAERADTLVDPVPLGKRLLWRLTIWGLGGLCVYLRFWSPWHVNYPLLLNLFALPVVPWLAVEIAHFRRASPWRWLELAGQVSYSLYLVHLFAIGTLGKLGVNLHGEVPVRLATLTTALVLAVLFHLLIERPSHYLAKKTDRGSTLRF